MSIKERIDAWVDEHERDIIADISRLVAVKSVLSQATEGCPFGEGPAEALSLAMDICCGHGLKVTNYDNYAMSADANDAETIMDILAHLDVVGEGEGWSFEPYIATESGGCLYGRGTDDDKGPAVAAIYAMNCILELGVPMKKNVRLILGTDEETGSRDIAYYYSKVNPAPNTFSPDASFPVYNTEKGGYTCRFTKKRNSGLKLPGIVSFDGGYRINVLPADARAVIQGLTAEEITASAAPLAGKLNVELNVKNTDRGVLLHVKGRSAHASTPQEGVNGITALIELLCALPLSSEDDAVTALHSLKKLLPHGDGEGKALGIAMSDELSGALSLAFSLFKIDENMVDGSFDSRTPLCANEENCKNVADTALRAEGFEVEGKARAPHHTDPERPFVKTLLNSYELYTGRKGECLSMGGGTYVHNVEGGVAFGAGMPGFDSHLHGADERLNIHDMLTACKIFAQVIYDMCC